MKKKSSSVHAEPMFVCNAAAVRSASRKLSQVYDDALAPSGLRSTQYSILSRIVRRGSASLNELAKDLAMDRSTLGHNLRPLERDGLVLMGNLATDLRTRTITISALGERKLAQARPLWARVNERFENNFGRARAVQLRALLADIASDAFVEAMVG